MSTLYQLDLARIHIDGFGFHWEGAAPCILRWLQSLGFRVRTRRTYGPYRLRPRQVVFIARKDRQSAFHLPPVTRPLPAMHITDLFDHPQHVDLAARWIYDEFWADKNVHTPASLARHFREATRPDAIPLSLIAFVDDEPVGTVNLIENDDDQRRHLRPWLAALYVVPTHRHRGVGSTLVRTLQQRAAALGIDTLYLGTDNPGFYTRLGATLHEQVDANFTVLRLSCQS